VAEADAAELKVGDYVRLSPWVTQEYLHTVWLLFDLDAVARLHRCTFYVEQISDHDYLGRLAYLTIPIFNPQVRWIPWSFVKVCYLEVCHD